MSKFEWQTEEDWEEIAIAESAPKSPRPRRWLWLASLVSLVVLAGYLIYQQVEQRVEEATNTVEQDVLSSLDVLEAANASGDVELVNGILSGRDPAWTDIQRDLIRASLLFDRSAFGLTLIGPPQVVSTTLSADLLAAQTTLHLDYAIAIGNGLTQTITLEQTAIFRQGARNWLFAPPEEEFWGDRAEISGSFISVQYPMRDEIISRRLANDLEQKIGELCARMAFDTVNCAGGVRVNLTLATHAGGLLMVKDPELWLQAGHELILPTPTLVGLPINEQAYQALYRGYAMVVLQAFIGERIGWQCCNRAALVGALLERQFAELALQSWPLLPQDYANLLNQGLLLADLVEIWDEAGFKEITPALYALADFLTNLTQTAVPATLIPIATGADTMNWMAAMMHSEPFSAESDRQWQAFLYEKSGLANVPPPIPWPDQAVNMLCGPNFPDAAALYAYHPATNLWTSELPGQTFFTLQPLPDHTGAVLVEQKLGVENQPPQTILWREGQTSNIFAFPFVLRNSNHQGNLLAGATLSFSDSNSDFIFNTFSTDINALINLDQCTAEGCPFTDLAVPNLAWSSNDQYALAYITRANSAGEFRILDGNGQPGALGAVATGTNGVWLDNDHLIYLRTPEIVKTNIHTKAAETVVAARDLQAALPDPDLVNRLSINHLALSQSDPNQLFVLATTSSSIRTAYLFQVNLATRYITFLTQLDDVPVPAIEIGKNFRIPVEIVANEFQIAVTIVHELNNPVYYFYTYQMAQDKTSVVKLVGGTNLGNYAWSSDGYWVVGTDEGVIKLMAPGWGYQRWVTHEFANCRAANWLNE